MENIRNVVNNDSSANKRITYMIGKYKINVKRESDKGGRSILENVMNLLYDEMESRKKRK